MADTVPRVKASSYDRYVDAPRQLVAVAVFAALLLMPIPRSMRDVVTGMFLAQCKTIRDSRIAELVSTPITVDVGAPFAEAVHLMVTHRLVSLPVIDGRRLVGVLRDRAMVLELARWTAV